MKKFKICRHNCFIFVQFLFNYPRIEIKSQSLTDVQVVKAGCHQVIKNKLKWQCHTWNSSILGRWYRLFGRKALLVF